MMTVSSLLTQRSFMYITLIYASLLHVVVITYYFLPLSSWTLTPNNDNTDCNDALLCIFTTFKPMKHKLPVYFNTLRNWMVLDTDQCIVKPIMFTTNAGDVVNQLTEFAQGLGWKIFPAPKVSKHGVPFVKDMYTYTFRRYSNCKFYAYSNGDILYSHGIIDTLQAVSKVLRSTTLVIGRRTDVRIRNRTLYKTNDVPHVANLEGRLHSPFGIDYFAIAGNSYPWHLVPDLVIGRPAYDNFLLAIASLNNVSVVDATCTVVALHQTDHDGIGSGQRNIDRNYNRRRISYKSLRRACKSTGCTKYVTILETNEVQQIANMSSIKRENNIRVVPRYRGKKVRCVTSGELATIFKTDSVTTGVPV